MSAALVRRVRDALGANLRSLSMFGSCLHASLRAPDTVPDLFAVVDDAPAAARAFGIRSARARLARLLPPATVALPDAKLNLIEPAALERALERLDDLTIAGRLSKRVEILHARDEEAAREIAGALDRAARAVVGVAFLGLARRLPLAAFARRCFGLSYRAEVRPETPARIAARFDAFASFYQARFGRLAAALAPPGITLRDGMLVDGRQWWARLRGGVALVALLWRGRVRSILRWPKAMLLYRGWWRYLVGKIRRGRAAGPPLTPSARP